MNPVFSIIIPTYNRATLIGNAIDSVIAQTFKDWQLLIVDDGSTDNTRQIVEAYRDSRINYVYQKNSERSAARNNGIVRASGKYICFLDSDDYYLPERLNLLQLAIKKVGTKLAVYYTGLAVKQKETITVRVERQPKGNVFDHLAESVIHSQQCCISAEILKEFRYNNNFHIGEDMELWMRIAEKYPFIFLEDQYSIVVVDHDERSVNVKRYNSYNDQLRMLKYVLSKKHPGHKISVNVKKKLLSNCFFGMAKYFIYKGFRMKAIANLLRAIVADIDNEQNKYRVNIIVKLLSVRGIDKAILLLG